MKNNKEKWHDWLFLHPGIACLLTYGGLFLVVITAGYIVFTQFNLFQTEPNSARYMLSALVQCQAAIVAIVISLTLIAVQITASAYSPRVIDAFRNNRDMRILLGSYAISIFYGLIVLKLIKGIEGEVLSHRVTLPFYHNAIPFEYFVSFALWLGAFTFAALFPYMLSIIDLLKPANIINRLSEDITGDTISNYIENTSKGDETSAVEDPVQPILDIIYGTLGKHDRVTTRKGLERIVELVIEVINTEEEEKKWGKNSRYSRYICNHLQRVSVLAASIADEESTKEAIIYLEKFGIYTAKQDLKEATEQVVMSLRAVGEATAENGLVDATERTVLSLEAVGKTAAEKGKELEAVTREAVLSLEAVGETAAEKELEAATRQAMWSLFAVGEAAAKNKLEYATMRVASSLEAIGKTAAEKGKELEAVTWHAAVYLEAVGKMAAANGLEATTLKVALSLRAIGEAAAKSRIEDATMRVASSLEAVGKTAAAKGLEDATKRVALSLLAVCKAAMENELEAAARQAASALASLSISSKEIVKATISVYESKLRESDLDSFLKIKKLYEHELEKRK